MRIVTCIALTWFVAGIANAEPEATGPGQILDAARQYLESFAEEQAEEGHTVNYEPGKLDSRLSLAPCENGIDVEFSGDPWQSTQPSLLVSCEGERPWRLYLSTSLEIHGEALVAAMPLARGDRITGAMISSEQVVLNSVRRGAITKKEQLLEMEMKRPVNAGTAFTPDLVTTPDAVARGDHVTIVARNGVFAVKTRGKALANARVGDQVLVENLTSARRIRARVTGPGQVEIAM